MNYIHKLKFKDKIECDEIFYTREIYSELIDHKINESIMTIYEIGTIIKPATFDEDGDEITPDKVVEGWHVDILANSIIEELRPYCLDHAPTNPQHGYDWADRPAMLVLKVGEVEI